MVKRTTTNNDVCVMQSPTGSFGAIPIGIGLIIVLIFVIDYLFVDIADITLSTEGLITFLGIPCGNTSVTDVNALIYLIIVSTSFIVGMVSLKWYKAIISAVVIPILFAVIYSLMRMSLGIGIDIETIIVTPLIQTGVWYIIPAMLSSLIVSSILAKKSSVANENFITNIK